MHAYRALTEPPGPARPVLGDRRPISAEIVFDGVRPATSGRGWVAVDIAVLILAGCVGVGIAVLTRTTPAVVGGGAAGVALAVLVVDLLRTGRSAGHRLLGSRTVDSRTGLVPTARGLTRTRTVDIRRGRDPLRVVPHAVAKAPVQSGQWQLTASRALDAPIVLTLDNGQAYSLLGPTVLGRNPARDDAAVRALQVPDLSRTISKSHALLEPQGGVLWVTDLGSMNGTAVALDGGALEPLPPHTRTVVRMGSTIEFGDRTATITSAGAPIGAAASQQEVPA